MRENGENGENRESSIEEDDLMKRSNKKTKHHGRNEGDMEMEKVTSHLKQTHVRDDSSRREGYSYRNATDGFQPRLTQQVHLGQMDYNGEDDYTDDEQENMLEIEDPHCPVIQLSKEEKARLRKPWLNTLIIKLFDRRMRYEDLIRNLRYKWSLKGDISLTDVGCAYYVVRFTNQEDYNFVLSGGPWIIGESYLTIRKWISNFVPDEAPIKVLTTWVRIPNLSVEYFDKAFLMKIGEKIGKVVKIDRHTEAMSRGQYIRLCVEVDISKPLLSKFRLNGRVWMIQYEGLRQICFKCGKLGHKEEQCTTFTREDSSSQGLNVEKGQIEANKIKASATQVTEERYGSWMLVQRPSRRTINRKQASQSRNLGSNLEANQVSRQQNNHGERVWKEKTQAQNPGFTLTKSRFDILKEGNEVGNQGENSEEVELVNPSREVIESGNKENKSKKINSVEVEPKLGDMNSKDTEQMEGNLDDNKSLEIRDSESIEEEEVETEEENNTPELGESQEIDTRIIGEVAPPTFRERKEIRQGNILHRGNSNANQNRRAISPRRVPFKENIQPTKLKSFEPRVLLSSNGSNLVNLGKENPIALFPKSRVNQDPITDPLEKEVSGCSHGIESLSNPNNTRSTHPSRIHNVIGRTFRGTDHGFRTSTTEQGGTQFDGRVTSSSCSEGAVSFNSTTIGANPSDESASRDVGEKAT